MMDPVLQLSEKKKSTPDHPNSFLTIILDHNICFTFETDCFCANFVGLNNIAFTKRKKNSVSQ